MSNIEISKNKYNKIHFVGIGGIGMSALARYYNSIGVIVSGSSDSESELIQELQKENIKVCIGHDSGNVPNDIDLLVYTVAIPSDNPELLLGIELSNDGKCRVLTYAQALGEMTKDKKTIAICGTHGKTTTTAMTFDALSSAELNVSMIVGSLINHNGKMTNYVTSGDMNNLDYIIIEACEYRKSFLNYNPEIILLTNIDADHLDYYKDIDEIGQAFQEFVGKLSPSGILITHAEEYDKLSVGENIKKINSDIFDRDSISLSVPGEHNRKNAQLVVALGSALALSSDKISKGLQNFAGTWRRQEYKGKYFDMECYDDYAHHPSEVRATLQAFREKLDREENKNKTEHKKIVACFMPHLYSRTKLLFADFVNCFVDADEVIILPIYAARESYDPSISSEMLVRELQNINKKALYLADLKSLKDYLNIHSNKNNVIITMGAGDIYKVYT